MLSETYFDDPVAGYDRLAPYYAEVSQRRVIYLRSVEDLIVARIAPGSSSLLDIGAGNGGRATRIAQAAGISHLALLEPSSGMAGLTAPFQPATDFWPIRAEHLRPEMISQRFDVITCLWNVLGHIRGRREREHALAAIARLLSPQGKFFMDVNHRYNARSYGALAAGARWIRDHLAPDETNGDAVARWNSGASVITTYGHVFTSREIASLARTAGLTILERLVIDYDTGQLRRFPFSGNLLYVFRRAGPAGTSLR